VGSEGDTTPKREPLAIELMAGMREDRTEAANRDMVELALRIPDLVATLFAVRDGDDPVAAADSADTITKVAARDPGVIRPYQAFVVRGLDAAGTQVRWESLATLALLATDDPSIVEPLLPRLRELIERDASVIVRDRAIDALTAYGVTSTEAARRVLPILEAALDLWNGKHAARSLRAPGSGPGPAGVQRPVARNCREARECAASIGPDCRKTTAERGRRRVIWQQAVIMTDLGNHDRAFPAG
jgi:hypothetical protein